jgi:hypothetical protein
MPPSRPSTARIGIALAALLLPALAAAQDGEPATVPVDEWPTARSVVERQLAAPPRLPAEMTGVEASRIMDLYLQSIGRMLQPRHEFGGSSPER